MSEQPDLSTLPQRMREAAKTLREAATAYFGTERDDTSWSVPHIKLIATEIENRHRANAKRDALVEALARELGMAESVPSDSSFNRAKARRLIESGWRKGDPE